MTSTNSVFRAGAATTGIQNIIIEHWSKKGVQWQTRSYDPLLRCLVLESDSQYTVIFSGDWGYCWSYHLDRDFKAMVEARLGDHAQVFCFATCANHNIDGDGMEWGALNEKDKRYDPVYHYGFLQAATLVLEEALTKLREARMSIGQGECGSITADGFWPESPDDADNHVDVLRLDNTEGQLIATIVTFAARADDVVRHILSGGFPRIMEQTVQSIYGLAPVFFLNGGYGRYLIMRRNPYDYATEKDAHLQMRAEHLDKDYLRAGRILGAEVCKVLAEIETAGLILQSDNERTREVVFAQNSPGVAVCEPRILTRLVNSTLWHPPAPALEECERNLQTYEKELKPLRKRLGGTPTNNTYYLLQPHDRESEVFRFMESSAKRKYWAHALGFARQEARGRRRQSIELEIGLQVFGPQLVVVMVPGSLCCSTAREIKRKSPFAHTLVWTVMAHCAEILLPEAETNVCGQHACYGLAQQSLNEMVNKVVENLKSMNDEYRESV